MIRRTSKCEYCPLYGKQKVPSQEGTNGVALIGNCPDSSDEERKQVFSGPQGRVLNMALHNLDVLRSGFWITNVINCRPPDGDIKSYEGKEAIGKCHSGLREELAKMKEKGVKVLVPMGQEALEAVGLDGNIAKVRGSVFKRDGFLIVPTYHPDFLLHGGGKRGRDGINLIAAFSNDIEKAMTIAKEGWYAPSEKFNLTPTVGDVRKFVRNAIDNQLQIALDIETTGLDARRGAQVVVVGLASSAENAIVVPILAENGNQYWSEGDFLEVKTLVEELFGQGRLLLQNCFFDVPFLMNSGWKISIDDVEHDTLVLHSLISPETEHNLGYIVSIYGQTPEWKEDFKHRSVPILQMDQLEMRKYNARDCVVLHQVIVPMLKQLEEYGLTDFYNLETKPLMKPFMQMTLEGVGFDFKHMGAFSAKMDKLIDEKGALLRKTYCLPDAFNFDSDDELRWLLFRQEPGKFKALEDLDKKKPGTAVYKKLCELRAIREIPELYTLSAFKGLKTDGGKTKVSKDGLLSYRIALQNRLATVNGLKNPKPDEEEAILDVLGLIELLSSYGELSKLKSAFCSYSPHVDGRIRPSWLMHGTSTGRLSCKSPNLAQLPSRGEGADVRRFFVAKDGWSIVDAD